MELTRRHALAGAAALAASPLLPSVLANAAAPMADKQAPSFYRYKVGDAQVTDVHGRGPREVVGQSGELRGVSLIPWSRTLTSVRR